MLSMVAQSGRLMPRVILEIVALDRPRTIHPQGGAGRSPRLGHQVHSPGPHRWQALWVLQQHRHRHRSLARREVAAVDVGRQDKGSRLMQPIGGYVLGQTVKVFAFHERETLLYFALAVAGSTPALAAFLREYRSHCFLMR